MSSVDIRSVHQLRERVDYLVYGVGEMKRRHRAAGTDRMAVVFCTTGDIDVFVARGLAIAERHGRPVQAHSVIQSFERIEADVNDPEDLRLVNDLGFALAQELDKADDSEADWLIITHGDAEGGCGFDTGCAHNHLVRLNHDKRTGRGIRRARSWGSVKKINDRVMRTYGMRTVDDRRAEILAERMERAVEATTVENRIPEHTALAAQLETQRRTTQATYWAVQRGELEAGEKHFDVMIGDAVTAMMLDPDVKGDDDLVEALSKVRVPGAPDPKHDGITMVVDAKHGGTKFRAWNPSTGRYNYRSASKLSPEFTSEGRHQVFAEKSLSLEERRQVEDAASEEATRRQIDELKEQMLRGGVAPVATDWVAGHRAPMNLSHLGREPSLEDQAAQAAYEKAMRILDVATAEFRAEEQSPTDAPALVDDTDDDAVTRRDVEQDEDHLSTSTAAPVGAAEPSAAASALGENGGSVREQMDALESALEDFRLEHDLAHQSRLVGVAASSPRAQQIIDDYAAWEPSAVAAIEKGEPIVDVPRGVRARFLDKYCDRMHPDLVGPLRLRDEMLTVATEQHARRRYEERDKLRRDAAEGRFYEPDRYEMAYARCRDLVGDRGASVGSDRMGARLEAIHAIADPVGRAAAVEQLNDEIESGSMPVTREEQLDIDSSATPDDEDVIDNEVTQTQPPTPNSSRQDQIKRELDAQVRQMGIQTEHEHDQQFE